MSFTYSFYRQMDEGEQRKSFAYWSGFDSLNGEWIWELIRSGEATCVGYGFPCWITVKAKDAIPHLSQEMSEFDPPVDPEELIEIEAWDQS